MRYSSLRPHNLLRGWAILWLLAIPLFHIHPETDPHHGETGHVHSHSGTVHTVFSGDLDSEFGHHRESTEGTTTVDSDVTLSVESLHDWKADPELGFSLLNHSTDRKLVKPLSTHIVFVAHTIVTVPLRRELPEQNGPSAFFSALVVREIPPRAPPSSLLG
ncbi:MAG: hypothetical protein HY348_01625 [Nitrospira defluvii]|nr:hypothetical protein [Nitrospira defluvii]